MCNKFISWGILLFFLVNSLSAGIIRVPQDYTTIQEGIDAAETREDTIIVSPGTYFEHINFLGKEILLGSQFITTQDTMYISQTIIDGSSTGTVVTFNSLESALSKLSGFTIQNGYTSDDGGGVYIGTNATPMMDNLVIQNSIAEDKGGGVYSLGSPRMDFVKIMGNQAVQNGGGVYSETQMLIFRSVFSGNTATRGGAIYAYSSILGIYLTQIYENEASLEGGGIASMYSSVLTIASSSIIHNDATYGGGLFTEYSATTNIDNTIFYLNTPDQLKLTNQSIVNIQYSDCEGGESTISITGEAVLNWNTGNFDLDPIFQSIDPMDLNLSWNSPCIDSGDPDPDDNGSSWESDIGDQDPDGTRMDLGPLYFDQVNRTSFEVIGTLSINRTLMVDTIKVIGDITIDTAVTLSIQSGVLIEFQDQYKINVNGSILAIGTSSEKIRFDESNLGNRWNGLRYQSTPMTSDTSKFIYCEFLNGIGADPDHWGGSIFAQDFGKIYVSHCLFENNTVPFAGGAIMLDDAGITIEDSEFRNNHSSVQGGAFWAQNSNIILRRNVFYNNQADSSGGALHLLDISNATVQNVTFVGNEAFYGGAIIIGNSEIEFGNNIFWNNSSINGQIYSSTPNVSFTYCDIEGGLGAIMGSAPGTFQNNIDSDPLFINQSEGNLYLTAVSPCIDSGDPDLDGDGTSWETDPDDQDPDGTRMDMGAYYFHHVEDDSASNKIILFGKGIENAAFTYDVITDNWVELVSFPDPAADLYDNAMAYDAEGDKIILFGRGPDNAAYNYDATTDTWIEITSFPDPTADLHDNAMVYDTESDIIILFSLGTDNVAYSYDAQSDTWIDLIFPNPAADLQDNAMAYDLESDKIILFGRGADNVVYSYDVNTDTWVELSSFPDPTGDYYDNAMAYDTESDKMILFCRGSDNAAYSYDVNTDTWVELSSFPDPTGDYQDNAMAYDYESDRIILFCRGPDNVSYSYDTNSDTWVELSSFPDPTGDYYDNAMAYSGEIVQRYSGPTWHVSTYGSDETGDGSSTSPFASIQHGINSSINGDTVLVQPGTYIENINYDGKYIVVSSLELTSGDTSYISSTIIDGNQVARVVTFNSGEDSTTVLNGFTIYNGYNSSITNPDFKGGGIYCQNASPTFSNLRVFGNTALYGGGIYLDASNSRILDVAIVSNIGSYDGGGLYLNNCSDIYLENVTITQNIASGDGGNGYGGGIKCWQSGGLFSNLSVNDNEALQF
ncbi:hypothetical protein HQ531_04440, partial [bacterium]|nr:hypothetical protein [bacterium]